MSFLKRRKASKWHLRVDSAAAGGVNSGTSTLTLADGHLLPRAQLATFTKEYLGRRKRPQEETDKALEDLIRDHPSKEVAFAACVGELSPDAVKRIMITKFPVDVKSLNGAVSYLQAFVSAAQIRHDVFILHDQGFAAAAVPVAQDLETQHLRPESAEALFDAWRTDTPFDSRLVEVGRTVTQRAIKGIEVALAAFRDALSRGAVGLAACRLAIWYSQVLSRNKAADGELKGLLDSNFNGWQAWACWRPNEARLQGWADIAANNPFANLLLLEGPNTSEDVKSAGSVWQAMIRSEQLSQGYTPAVGLIVGDTEQLLGAFVNRFLDTAAVAVQQRQAALLQYLIARDGLDLQPLTDWQAITMALEPKLIDLLMSQPVSLPPGSDILVVRGLNALSSNIFGAMRRCLQKEVAACVASAESLQLGAFRTDLIMMGNWIAQASRLWRLRTSVLSSTLLQPSLEADFMCRCRSPVSDQQLAAVHDLQYAVNVADEYRDSRLAALVEVYIESLVAGGQCNNEQSTAIPAALHAVWMSGPWREIREAALAIGLTEILDHEHRIKCITSLEAVDPAIAQTLGQSLTAVRSGEYHMIIPLTHAIWSLYVESKTPECWQALLVTILKFHGIDINGRKFTSSPFSPYRIWILQLHDVVGDSIEGLDSTRDWVTKLDEVKPALETLQHDNDASDMYQMIVTERDTAEQQRLSVVLHCLGRQTLRDRKELMHHIILSISICGSTKGPRAVLAIEDVSSTGFVQCQSLMAICSESRAVACVRLTIWMRIAAIEDGTKHALLSLAGVLQLNMTTDLKPSVSSLAPGEKDFARRVAMLVAKTQQLEQARMVLKRKDPVDVMAMTEELGLEQPRGVAALTTDLPHDLISFVDATADDRLELMFPLSDLELNAVQRLAFGLKESDTLSVYLRTTDAGLIDGFCVHIRNHGSSVATSDRSWVETNCCPEKSHCNGNLTRLAYIVTQGLWDLMQESNDLSIKTLYEAVQVLMRSSGSRCMICLAAGSARLHRPTYCTNAACAKMLLRCDLDMRIEDVRNDGRVVDLLLTSVFATAVVGKLDLLPECPAKLKDPTKLSALLNSLSSTSTVAKAPNTGRKLKRTGPQAELLLSWLCVSYRGFLISATGRFKIPHMAKIHRFLLVDASPEVEVRFAKHTAIQPRNVLFHGTSMDRLYSILTQGLRVLSGTDLMKHGQAHGQGIYLTNNPGVAWSIAGSLASASSEAFFRSRPDFQNAAVVLGCEHAGNDNSDRGSNVHVVTDESRIMVRYIFLFQPGTPAPRAQDISGPMLSTFSYLRASVSG
ncbi:hypothetical protein LTR09_011833 [Extremus antarcticus]|uniref:PARP catalytic domain-containing protein n=1 Tax=Extremus antarcticus TaxID=702011 RepID=A0AAJ0D5V5_9PEZI|nr:hypothetical protein LTR09_011833 [Extremus antarcticus]